MKDMQSLVFVILGTLAGNVVLGQVPNIGPATGGDSDDEATDHVELTTRPFEEISSTTASQTGPAAVCSSSIQIIQSAFPTVVQSTQSMVVIPSFLPCFLPQSSLETPRTTLGIASSLTGLPTTSLQSTKSSALASVSATMLSSTTSTLATSSSSSEVSQPINSARDIGIGVGIGLVCALFLVGITAWFLLRRFRRQNRGNHLGDQNSHNQPPVHPQDYDQTPIPIVTEAEKRPITPRMSELESPITRRTGSGLPSSEKTPPHEAPTRIVRVKSKLVVELP